MLLQSKMTCPAVKKDGKICGKPSKFGQYCGIHKGIVVPRNASSASSAVMNKIIEIQSVILSKIEGKTQFQHCSFAWIAILFSQELLKQRVKHFIKIGFINVVDGSHPNVWIEIEGNNGVSVVVDPISVRNGRSRMKGVDYSIEPKYSVYNGSHLLSYIQIAMIYCLIEGYWIMRDDVWTVVNKNIKKLSPIIGTDTMDSVRDVRLAFGRPDISMLDFLLT